MAAAQETLLQSTDVDTPYAAAVQIEQLHLRITDLHDYLHDEILDKGIDLGIMKASFDNLYSMAGVAGRLPPDRQIDILGKLVGMLEKALARGPKSSPRTEFGPSGSAS
jgi:hypothetical protein